MIGCRWYLIEGWPGSTAGGVAQDADEVIIGMYLTRRGAERARRNLTDMYRGRLPGIGWRVTSARDWENR